jgi:hypothetical protein
LVFPASASWGLRVGWRLRFRSYDDELVVRNYRKLLDGAKDAGDALADDAALHVVARGPLGGDYRGRAAVLAYVQQLEALSNGTFRAEVTRDGNRTDKKRHKHNIFLNQHIAAHRNGRVLEADGQVEVRPTRKGCVREAWVTTNDPNSDDQLWSGGVSVLTPADGAIIASAIRRAEEPRLPSPFRMSLTVAFVLAGAIGLGYVYHELTQRRPNAGMKMPLTQLADQSGFTVNGGNRGVQWEVADARSSRLDVTGPGSGDVAIDLPVAKAQCTRVSSALADPGCSNGAMTLGPPFTVTWTGAQDLSASNGSKKSGRYASSTVDVALANQTTQHELSFVGSDSASLVAWCFSTPADTSTLTLSAGSRNFSMPVSPANGQVKCGTGVRVVIHSNTPANNNPVGLAVAVHAPTSLLMEVTSPALNVRGTGASIELQPGGTHVISRTTETAIVGHVDTNLVVQSGQATIKASGSAHSIVSDKGQLVLSYWERNKWWLASIFVTLAGILLTTLLATFTNFAHWVRSRH